jgi:hypothetical protein
VVDASAHGDGGASWPPGAVGVDEQSMSIHGGNDTM